MADDGQQQPPWEREDNDIIDGVPGEGDGLHNNRHGGDDILIFPLNNRDDEEIPRFLVIPRDVNSFVIFNQYDIEEDDNLPRFIPIPRRHDNPVLLLGQEENNDYQWFFINNGRFGNNYLMAQLNDHLAVMFRLMARERGDGLLTGNPNILRLDDDDDDDEDDDDDDEGNDEGEGEGEGEEEFVDANLPIIDDDDEDEDGEEEFVNGNLPVILDDEEGYGNLHIILDDEEELGDREEFQGDLEQDWSCEPLQNKRGKLSLDEHPEDATLSTPDLSYVRTSSQEEDSEEPAPSTSGLSSIRTSSQNKDSGNPTSSTSGRSSPSKRKLEETCEPRRSKRRKLSLEEHCEHATPSISLSSVRNSSQDEDPALSFSSVSSPSKKKLDKSCEPRRSKRGKLSLEEHCEHATPSTSLSSIRTSSQEEDSEEPAPSTSGLSSIRTSNQNKDSENLTSSTSGRSSPSKRKLEETCEPRRSKRRKLSLNEHPEDETPSTSLSYVRASSRDEDPALSFSSVSSPSKKKHDKSCEPRRSKRRKLSLNEHPEDATPSTSLSYVRASSQDKDSKEPAPSTSGLSSPSKGKRDESCEPR